MFKSRVTAAGVVTAGLLILLSCAKSEPYEVSATTAKYMIADIQITGLLKSSELPSVDNALVVDVEDRSAVDIREHFTSFAMGFDTWCRNLNQLGVDYTHAYSVCGVEITLQETSTQWSQETNQNHVYTRQENYDLDMWYNREAKDYYVSLDIGDDKVSWVHMNPAYASGKLYNFIDNQIVAPSQIQSVSTILLGLIDSYNSEITQTEDGWYLIQRDDEFSTFCVPAFVNCELVDVWYTTELNGDELFLSVIFTYTSDSLVDNETFTFKIYNADGYNLDYPDYIQEDNDSLKRLEKVYEDLVGGRG